MLNEDILKTVEGLFEAGYQRELWLDGLHDLSEIVGTHGIVTVPRVAAENAVHLPFSRTLTDMTRKFVEDGWYANDVRADRGWPMVDAGHPVVLEQDIILPEEQTRLAVYQELYRPHDLLWWAGVTFETRERQYTMSMIRRPEQGPFTENDRTFFLHIRHYLAKALSIAETIGNAAGHSSIDVLEATGQAALLINGWGRVVGVTRQAEALLSSEIMVSRGRLLLGNTSVNRLLHAQIARVISERGMPASPVVLPRRNSRPLLLDILPVPAANRTDFLFAHAIIVLVDLNRREYADGNRLQKIFGLSPREVELVLLLAECESLSEAAERLMISRETARSHLKSIFIKTQTNRQIHLLDVIRKASRQ